MDASHVDLWRKICAFELDSTGDALTFTQRLAHENGWSQGFARRVVEEYKRFVFLAMTAGHEVTPSDAVDQAWHLHLLYTRSYWDGLCRGVLGRPLHHGPTKGGRDESLRFAIQYQETLSSYREQFGEEPPSDVWPHGDSTPARKPRFKRINVAESWVVPKPWPAARQLIHKPTSGAACCVAPVLLAIANPLNLKGPDFLAFYLCVAGIAIVAALVVRHLLRTSEGVGVSPGRLDPYQVAYLAGGVAGEVRAAIVSLIKRGATRIVRLKGSTTNEYRLVNIRESETGRNEVELHVLAASNTPDGCYLLDAVRAAAPATEPTHRQLEAWGLVMPAGGMLRCQVVPALMMLAVALLGVAKIVVGLSRGKPVEYLLLLVIVTTMVAALLLKRPLRTRAGDAMLGQIRSQHDSLAGPWAGERERLEGDGVVLAAALFGISSIAIDELAQMPDAWRYRAGPKTVASTENSCGSSFSCGGGGGGGGCGGGGCGGGCGGCGGD